MPTRFTVICDDESARSVRRLAQEDGLSEQEVLRQLIELGLERVEGRRDVEP